MTAAADREDTGRKARLDAWWSALTEEERWGAWDKMCRLPWQAVAKWLESEKGLKVSRSALYRFGAWIRPQASARRLELAVLARKEAQGLAKAAGARQDLADAFMAMGAEVALRSGDASDASGWIKMAASLVASAQKDAELRLREKAQSTAEEQLRLAREKFEAAEKREAAAKGVIGDSKLSDGDKLAKMKEIFG